MSEGVDEMITMHCQDCPWEATADPRVPLQALALASVHRMAKKTHEIVLGARDA